MCNINTPLYLFLLIFRSSVFSSRVRREEGSCPEQLPFELPNFQCKNGDCIPGQQECDGQINCEDGSDETDDCKLIKCSSLLFTCNYGACIKRELECNGKFDCRDGSDENSPSCKDDDRHCNSDEFRCKSGQCIERRFKCDGKAECDDHSDETKSSCSDVECSGLQYKCDYGACAKLNAPCNGVLDCFDGSDEDPKVCNPPAPTTVPPPPSLEGGCTLPQQPESGQWSIHGFEGNFLPGQSVSVGTVLHITCNKNHKLEGPNALFCEEGGKWSSNIGFCSKLCAPRFSTETMEVTCIYKSRETQNCTEAVDGTLAKFKCAPFYEDETIKKRPVHICKNGEWDQTRPNCVPVCGQKSVDATTLIVNGTNAVKGDYPWQVAIYTINNKYLICGGSLLTQRTILTAAHCVTDIKGKLLPKENYYVAVGKYYRTFEDSRDNESQYSELSNMLVPRQYRGYNQNYLGDIAILVTVKTFTLSRKVQPVCLDAGQNFVVPENTNGYVTGWGFTTENRKPSEVLKELKVPSVSVATCNNYLPEDYEIYLTHDKMCAGFVHKSTAVCKGDSGGALVFKHGGRYYVTGVVSLAPTSPTKIDGCDSQQFGLYTKVLEYVNDFILPTLADYKT